jgi:light-regulated signal transduction histidine kinase (bacteriophytochrome)
MDQLELYNKELNEKNTKLTLLNEELMGLTFVASHDLREPIRKIRLFIQRLLKEEHDHLSEKGIDYFERILSFVQTMNDLVADITLYSNYKDRRGQPTSVNVETMLASLNEFLSPMLEYKNASMKFNVVEGLVGDYEQVKQVVYSLISNALKFRKPDVPLEINIKSQIVHGIQLAESRADKTKNYYQIDVIDNGIGIDPAYINQIFDLFRRLHGKSTYPGNGIGLTIVRRIMENHQGFVTVDSKPGSGSVFSCFFPLTAESSSR